LQRSDEAIAQNLDAVKLDPISAEMNLLLGQTYYLARRYDEYQAGAGSHRYVSGSGIVAIASDVLAWSYAKKGQLDEAIQAIEKARRAQPEFTEAVGSLGWASALKGDRKTSQSMLIQLDALGAQKYWVEPYFYAIIYAGLGDKDCAFRELDNAYEARSWYMAVYMAVMDADPKLDNLRSDPKDLTN
jgi:tetratricopeptide (TPR) repeat protein